MFRECDVDWLDMRAGMDGDEPSQAKKHKTEGLVKKILIRARTSDTLTQERAVGAVRASRPASATTWSSDKDRATSLLTSVEALVPDQVAWRVVDTDNVDKGQKDEWSERLTGELSSIKRTQ